MIRNLVENAVNYTVSGSVKITIAAEQESAVIKVEDTGIGISSDHLPRIFERFYRVDKGRSRQSGGTGLGLSISRHIVEKHGGTITVDSMLNRGTTMIVSIPRIMKSHDPGETGGA